MIIILSVRFSKAGDTWMARYTDESTSSRIVEAESEINNSNFDVELKNREFNSRMSQPQCWFSTACKSSRCTLAYDQLWFMLVEPG